MSLQGSLSLERMCRLVPVSRRGFYRSLKEQQPAEEEMEVRSAIQQIPLEHRRPYIRLKAEFVYLAVTLDGFSRKVVGWALDRTLAMRLTFGALQQAIESRHPEPGLVHHSDRGLQYASEEYAKVFENNRVIPSMSRPANSYDNASCESFMKTLKREEIYANNYNDLEHLRGNIEEFIEQHYIRLRLHRRWAIDLPKSSSNRSRRQVRPDHERNDGVFFPGVNLLPLRRCQTSLIHGPLPTICSTSELGDGIEV